MNGKEAAMVRLVNKVKQLQVKLASERLGEEVHSTQAIIEGLSGHCRANAMILQDMLEEEMGIKAQIVQGALDYVNEPTPSTTLEAQKQGTRHYWLQIVDKSTEFTGYHCDIMTETPEKPITQPLLKKELPSTYITFS